MEWTTVAATEDRPSDAWATHRQAAQPDGLKTGRGGPAQRGPAGVDVALSEASTEQTAPVAVRSATRSQPESVRPQRSRRYLTESHI